MSEHPVYVKNDFREGDRITVDGEFPYGFTATVQASSDSGKGWPVDVELLVLRDGAVEAEVVFPNVAWVELGKYPPFQVIENRHEAYRPDLPVDHLLDDSLAAADDPNLAARGVAGL